MLIIWALVNINMKFLIIGKNVPDGRSLQRQVLMLESRVKI